MGKKSAAFISSIFFYFSLSLLSFFLSFFFFFSFFLFFCLEPAQEVGGLGMPPLGGGAVELDGLRKALHLPVDAVVDLQGPGEHDCRLHIFHN